MKVTIALLAAMLPTAALANTDADAQVWSTLSASGSLSGPIMIGGDIQGRYSNDQSRIAESQYTAQLGYKFSKKVTAWIGYRRVLTHRNNLPNLTEHRIRPQLNLDLGKLAGGSLANRTIVEFRYRDDIAGMGARFRNQLKWQLPVKKGSKTNFILSHEDFIGLNSTAWGQQSGYTRMRNFIGIGTPVLPKLRGEFGYLNQWDIRRRTYDRVAHVAQFNLAYSF
jgi:Protein of unknown function (DUF2490)